MTSMKLYATQLGKHVHVKVFSGPAGGTRGNCGTLVMEKAEWKLFGACMDIGRTQMQGHLSVEIEERNMGHE